MIKKDGVYKVLGYEFTEVESVNVHAANYVENPVRVTSVEVDIEANDNLNNRFMVEKLGMILYQGSYYDEGSLEQTFLLYDFSTRYTLTLRNKQNNKIMSTKKTFKIKLDAEFTIDFGNWGFTDAQKSKIEDFKTMILDEYIAEVGYDEFEVTGDSSTSLLEVMSEMFNQNKK